MFKRTSSALAFFMALLLMFSAFSPAFAADENDDALASAETVTQMVDAFSDIADTIDTDVTLPESFTLTNLNEKNYVTGVKSQGLLQICWGFSAVSCMETSLIYQFWNEKGIDLGTALDLSELQIGWFARSYLDEESTPSLYSSQIGEGTYLINGGTQLDGALPYTAVALVASGIGPVSEADVPFKNSSGLKVTTQASDGKTYELYYYTAATENQWAVDNSYKFSSLYALSEGLVLPSPATIDMDDNGNLSYEYNEAGLVAIKQQLLSGHSVAIGYNCYQGGSLDGQDSDAEDGDNMNHKTYAVYNYETSLPNHAVTIVGYDDTYSKENFGVDGKAEHQPKNDGAFIVKNSWGSVNGEFPNQYYWGVEGDGYFYISYEDQSLYVPTTFDFDLDATTEDTNIYQYDFMQLNGYDTDSNEGTMATANVFTAENNESLYAVSSLTSFPGTETSYKIYLLNENAENPEDGTLVYENTLTYEYGGYHRLTLDNPIEIEKGQSYSVVAANTIEGNEYPYFVLNTAQSKESVEAAGSNAYKVAVVNEGESYLLSQSKGWYDFTQYIEAWHEEELAENNGAYYDTEVDNIGIKAYTKDIPTPSITIDSNEESLEESYEDGQSAALNVDVTLAEDDSEIAAQSDSDDSDLVTVTLSDDHNSPSVTQSVEKGKTTTLTLNYTVSKDDADENGVITNTVTINADGYQSASKVFKINLKSASSGTTTDTTDTTDTAGKTDSADTTTSTTTATTTANQTNNVKTGVETNMNAVYAVLFTAGAMFVLAAVVIYRKKARQQ